MTRLVQIQNGGTRRVALVSEPHLNLLKGFESVYELAKLTQMTGQPVGSLLEAAVTDEILDYDLVHAGKSTWRLLPPIDHPFEPARCLVSGTGLTHLGSAKNRQNMHLAQESELTDSMKMFRLGVAGGKPVDSKMGVAPEWFYKGNGTILRAHNEPLEVPAYAEDGGEEAEIAGIYFIDADGSPCRLGMAVGNEFSDHEFERHNYLNLAGSKIRTCALGPELVIAAEFQSVPGRVAIERAGRELWAKEIATGEIEMCHSLGNLEQHHFKFETHRRPGDVHVHYFGAHSLSFGDGLRLVDGDLMKISFDGFGRALCNPLRVERREPVLVNVKTLF